MPKILLVEDDDRLLQLYRQLLESDGYEVEMCSNGNDASEKMIKGGYDLVLLDIMLPGKDGLQILEELRTSKPEKKNGGIILLTNLAQNETIERALQNQISGYIIKSRYSPEEFLNQVKQTLHDQNSSLQ